MVIVISIANSALVIPVTGEQSVPASNKMENKGLTLRFENGVELLIAGQPGGSIGYVSNMPGVVTNFQQAEKLGSTGLIAHNYLSGEEFFGLEVGDRIMISDERTDEIIEYQVIDVEQYQALQTTSIHSKFKNLENDEIISAHQLSQAIYGQAGHLILQTCIENEGDLEWGRLFVIAAPVSDL
jgi:hypothetical protein